MTERDTIEKIKDKGGAISKIQNFFTLGYGTKEDLRELNKKLRDFYYEDLRNMRRVWGDLYLAAIDAGLATSNRNFKEVVNLLDRIMEKVRHADYGYAGLMDRKGHIRENELARIFNYDKELNNDLDSLKKAVNEVWSEAEAENWTIVPKEVKRIKGSLLDLENRLHDREKQFRPLDI